MQFHTFEGQCDPTKKNDTVWPGTYSYFAGDGVDDTAAHTKLYRNCSASWDTCPDDVEGVDPGYV